MLTVGSPIEMNDVVVVEMGSLVAAGVVID